jgi:hypothetical protein
MSPSQHFEHGAPREPAVRGFDPRRTGHDPTQDLRKVRERDLRWDELHEQGRLEAARAVAEPRGGPAMDERPSALEAVGQTRAPALRRGLLPSEFTT